MCFLYESEWSKDRIPSIGIFVREVEAKLDTMFPRAPADRLERCEDADRILGALVMSSRVFNLRAAQERVK